MIFIFNRKKTANKHPWRVTVSCMLV